MSRAITRIPSWIRALAFYIVLAILSIGWHAVTHPQTVCACVGTADPAAYMWALSWWPHAILSGLNPFVTHYQWSPTGTNLAQAAMIPTAAIIATPITALFGPLFSYNALAILSPALAAFTAYLLCRRLIRKELAAVVGGLLYGFSSYEFAQLLGHLNLVMTFLLPVMVHMSLMRVDREVSRVKYVLGMAVLIFLQIGLSTELLAESVAIGLVVLVAARLIAVPPQRERVFGLILETILAGLLAAVVSAPFLYYALFSGGLPQSNPALSDAYPLDFANLIFPSFTTWLGHHDFQSLWATYDKGDVSEANGYFSLPILIAFGAWLLTSGWRSVLGKLLAVGTLVSIILAMGSHLHVAGNQTITLPYSWVKTLPIFDNIIPARIVVFSGLAIAIGVAAWLAARGTHMLARWSLVLLGILLLVPNLTSSLYGVPPFNPRFFSTSLYRHYLSRNETVLMLPFGHNDNSTLWQAETGFYFYMPEGYVSSQIPAPFEAEPGVTELFNNVAPAAPVLGSFIRAHSVSDVVVDPTQAGPWPRALQQLGFRAQSVGGVLLFHVPDSPA
ncbi:MAG TPA: hypothetical protein VMB51_08710 [Solirubrobacteraceae bacterium]|nr:hypothetical protein [Solirubrobacteraceae bacterium]